MKAWRLLLLAAAAAAAALPAVDGFKLLIDLNGFTTAELSRVSELPSGLDGVWEMTANTHPTSTDAAWRSALQTISAAARVGPNGSTLPVVAENNPTDHSTGGFCPYCECRRYHGLYGRPPEFGFGSVTAPT